jgi:integrase
MAQYETLPRRKRDNRSRTRATVQRARHTAPTDQVMWRATFDTKAAARAWAERVERSLDRGHVPGCACPDGATRCAGPGAPAPAPEPARPQARTLTLAAWRERWWPTYCKSTAKAPRSVEATDIRWRKYLGPRWGSTLLAHFDRLEIQEWVTEELPEECIGTAYVHLLYKDLHLLLGEAADNRPPILLHNPCHKIRLPELDTPEAIFTDAAGVAGLAGRCGFYSDLVWCLWGTGWRWGEIAGLRRDLAVGGNRNPRDNGPCVDPDAGVLRVHPTLGCLIEANSGSPFSGPPKTRSSARTTAVPPFVMDMVLARLDATDGPHVFYGPRGGLLRRSGFHRRVWRPACDGRPAGAARRGTAGREEWGPLVAGMHVHGLRHSHKAELEAAGIPDSAIEARLGHARGGISGTYSHVLPEVENQIVKALQGRYEIATL